MNPKVKKALQIEDHPKNADNPKIKMTPKMKPALKRKMALKIKMSPMIQMTKSNKTSLKKGRLRSENILKYEDNIKFIKP